MSTLEITKNCSSVITRKRTSNEINFSKCFKIKGLCIWYILLFFISRAFETEFGSTLTTCSWHITMLSITCKVIFRGKGLFYSRRDIYSLSQLASWLKLIDECEWINFNFCLRSLWQVWVGVYLMRSRCYGSRQKAPVIL